MNNITSYQLSKSF